MRDSTPEVTALSRVALPAMMRVRVIRTAWAACGKPNPPGLGFPFPSPALFNQIGQRFRRAVESYAANNDIPWIKFGKTDDKLTTMGPHLRRRAATGRSGVAAIRVAQEFQRHPDRARHRAIQALNQLGYTVTLNPIQGAA